MSDNAHSNGSATGGIGLVTVIIALIFLFVWPGPFRYEYRDGWGYRTGDSQTASVPAGCKIDRISHQVWDYDPSEGKWVKR